MSFIKTVLQVEASDKLAKEVEEELKKEDPKFLGESKYEPTMENILNGLGISKDYVKEE